MSLASRLIERAASKTIWPQMGWNNQRPHYGWTLGLLGGLPGGTKTSEQYGRKAMLAATWTTGWRKKLGPGRSERWVCFTWCMQKGSLADWGDVSQFLGVSVELLAIGSCWVRKNRSFWRSSHWYVSYALVEGSTPMYMWATLTELSGLPKIYFYIQIIYIHTYT